ncbi:hypothetical protein BCV72DRAFT_204531 [Rhizopus microsporus var. microsporus]|nr:hypothetical protein BCV72DRAFT_204531 [Rhizopus microsporus var. microsporus]
MHQFPSNVAGMIVVFFLLICAHTILPTYTDKFVQLIDPYSSFALRSMNIMFVPAVVEMVQNSPTPGPEVGRMICVFMVGYFIGFIITTLLVRASRFLIFYLFNLGKEASMSNPLSGEKAEMHTNRILKEETVAIDIPEAIRQEANELVIVPSNDMRNISGDAISSNTVTDRSSYLDNHVHHHGCCCSNSSAQTYIAPSKHRHGPLHSFAVWCMKESNFDDLSFFLIFCFCAFIFLPLPENNPAMPFFRLFLYLSMTVLLYSASCRLPPKLRIIFHPIIVTSAAVMAGIAYFERVKGFDIIHGVGLYKSGITFISLVEKTHVGWPGAGDILATTMDVSIISLAFNVYKNRPSLVCQWIVVIISIAPVAFLVMFITPMFAHAIGCTPDDSLVWSSRSVTTAIGIVIGRVLGANQSVVTCIIVFTGIMGPIFGPILFKITRVKEDDYMTIGITMGSHSHGVGTAYLISKNPKASGMSSIAFAIFGTLGVVVASIPALSDTIKRLSGF